MALFMLCIVLYPGAKCACTCMYLKMHLYFEKAVVNYT